MNTVTKSPDSTTRRSSLVPKLILLFGFLSAFVFAYTQYGDALTLENVAQNESALRSFQSEHPVSVYVVAFLIYVAVTGLSLPGAAVLTLAYGWFFGFLPAVVLVSFASTAGASLAFLSSRYLLHDWVQSRFGDRLEKFNEALKKEGAFYLFTLRLIPAVPFFVINVVMGLTPIRLWTYWWVSQVGMLAGTCVYVYAGASIPTSEKLVEQGVSGILSWQLILAFVILGIFPIVTKKILSAFSSSRQSEQIPADSSP